MVMAREQLLWTLLMLLTVGQCTSNYNCTHLLHRLAQEQKNFVQCSTLHAVPVNLCIECKPNHDLMIEAYVNISQDKNCSDIFFNTDRINIISTMQSTLIDLWSKAFCDDCFNKEHTAITFNEKYTILDRCFTIHKSDECTACQVEYLDLNNFYITMDQHNNGQICYDIQDQMNRTRSKWSKEFKCCRREFDMTLFITASSLIALLPLIFYTGIYKYGKKRENNHGILDAETTTTSPQDNQAPGPSSQIQNASISETVPSNAKKVDNSDTESD